MLDEDLQDVLRQMNEHYQKEVQSIRSVTSQRDAELQQIQAQEEVDRFDKTVQSLGEEWKDMFGEGSGSELAAASQSDPSAMTHFNYRAKLFDSVQEIRERNAESGHAPLTP
jgi:hypothetical protein